MQLPAGPSSSTEIGKHEFVSNSIAYGLLIEKHHLFREPSISSRDKVWLYFVRLKGEALTT
jgi:hypothetical protein